jgi:hypothetical protein
LAFTLLTGAAIEGLQFVIHDRTPDGGDVLRNLLGASVFLFFGLAARKQFNIHILRSIQVVVITCILMQLHPLAMALTDEWRARGSFPVLLDLESSLELTRLRGNAAHTLSNDVAALGKSSLKIRFQTNKYSGVVLKYMPRDWRGYKTLHFKIYNPVQEPLEINCVIYDRIHTQGIQAYEDRFNQPVVLQSQWNTITFSMESIQFAPARRLMDMSDILGIRIFTKKLPRPRVAYLDDVRLIK